MTTNNQNGWSLLLKGRKPDDDNSHCANGICALHVMVMPEGSNKFFPALLTLKHEDHEAIKNEINNQS